MYTTLDSSNPHAIASEFSNEILKFGFQLIDSNFKFKRKF
jgi:hypothetical protein